MTSEGLGEMFEGDSADMCAEKYPLMLMGGRAEGLAYADPGARTPIAVSGNCLKLLLTIKRCIKCSGLEIWLKCSDRLKMDFQRN